jgi:hypothetical protein
LGKKKGVFKADEMVDIILNRKHPNDEKTLSLFMKSNEALVRYYGDYFRTVNLNSNPLTKIFTEEFDKKISRIKIKNPLEFSLQLVHDSAA